MGKVCWDDATSRKLLVIMVDDKERGCSKYDWKRYAKALGERIEGAVTTTQCTNHIDMLKMKYKAYSALKNLTGISINSITKQVDVEERATERWKGFYQKYKYGKIVAFQELPNVDLMDKLFGGMVAHGVGGCFSPAMAAGTSYLSTDVGATPVEEEANITAEGLGDTEQPFDMDDDPMPDQSMGGFQLSTSPTREVPRTTENTKSLGSGKRKSEDTIQSAENKRRNQNFDDLVKLMKEAMTSTSTGIASKAQVVADTLNEMDVQVEKGVDFYVTAMTHLTDPLKADTFLALPTEAHKWVYLKKLIPED